MITSTFDKATGFEKRFENITTVIFKDSYSASIEIAKEIADLIRFKQSQGQPCILGLATGSTPKDLYAELVRLHKYEGLSFSNVISFNLDEYYPMQPDATHSFFRFMKTFLFDHVDIRPENYYIPDGSIPEDAIKSHCEDYESKIEALGGIDLQILGIGCNGHIAFNESGSLEDSKTRLVVLDDITRHEASKYFPSPNDTPTKAITLGVNKIMESKRVILMAWGEGKADIITSAIESKTSCQNPASFLQNHKNVTFVIDQEAASKLTRNNSPSLVNTNSVDK